MPCFAPSRISPDTFGASRRIALSATDFTPCLTRFFPVPRSPMLAVSSPASSARPAVRFTPPGVKMLLSSISFMVCPYALGTDVRKVYGVSATPATNFPTGEVARLESGRVLMFESMSYAGLNVCEAAGSLPMVFWSTFGAGVF